MLIAEQRSIRPSSRTIGPESDVVGVSLGVTVSVGVSDGVSSGVVLSSVVSEESEAAGSSSESPQPARASTRRDAKAGSTDFIGRGCHHAGRSGAEPVMTPASA